VHVLLLQLPGQRRSLVSQGSRHLVNGSRTFTIRILITLVPLSAASIRHLAILASTDLGELNARVNTFPTNPFTPQCLTLASRFRHSAAPISSAENKVAEIRPCANTKTTFFNTRSCRNRRQYNKRGSV